MLTIAGGIVLGVLALAFLPFLLRGAAAIVAIGAGAFLLLFCIGHWPETTAAVSLVGVLAGGWRLKHVQNRDAKRREQERDAENERRREKGIAPLGVLAALAPAKITPRSPQERA